MFTFIGVIGHVWYYNIQWQFQDDITATTASYLDRPPPGSVNRTSFGWEGKGTSRVHSVSG